MNLAILTLVIFAVVYIVLGVILGIAGGFIKKLSGTVVMIFALIAVYAFSLALDYNTGYDIFLGAIPIPCLSEFLDGNKIVVSFQTAEDFYRIIDEIIYLFLFT